MNPLFVEVGALHLAEDHVLQDSLAAQTKTAKGPSATTAMITTRAMAGSLKVIRFEPPWRIS
jgi:hypothetical protein